MAFRTLKHALIVIAILVVILFLHSRTPHAAPYCYDIGKFVEAVKDPKTIIMIGNAEASRKIVEKINANRLSQNRPQIDGSRVVIGLISSQESVVAIGVAIFDSNGCVVPDTVGVVPVEQWVAFTTEAGVSIEDFSKLQDS